MLIRFLVPVLLLVTLLAQAQAQAPDRRPGPVHRPPRPVMSTPASDPVQLQSLQVSADITGGMALTRVRMVFFNPNARVLEGELQFPLLPGQQVTAFALDIGGELRPAVPVEKARGRQVFEEIERQSVDPGLLEQTQGNNFKLRVYPIPANGTRIVELTYAEALSRDGANWSYRVPLGYGQDAREVGLSLSVHGSDAAPKVVGAPGAVNFERKGDGYVASVARARFAATGTLHVQVPAGAQPQAYVQEHDGAMYFVAEIPLPTGRTARRLPRSVGLLWDSSGSGASRDHAAELAELDRYFRAIGNAQVRLVRLRDRAAASELFKVSGGNWSALRRALETTVYDGASALAAWTPERSVEEYLLVSDGLLNYGAQQFPALSAGQRLYAMTSSLAADTSRLAALAERSGGRLVQVRADRPGSAADSLLTEPVGVRGIAALGAGQVLAAPGEHDGLQRIAGKLTSDNAQVVLTLANGKEVTLPVSSAAPSHPLAAHLWASYRLHELEADPEANRAAIRRLGTAFGMPTRETSLLVLDRIEDYVRYDIRPPEPLLAQYRKLKAERVVRESATRQEHLERVVREFTAKVAWWDKAWPKGAPPKPDDKREAAPVAVAATGATPAPEARMMEAAPPAPSPTAAYAPPPPPGAEARERGSARAARSGAAPGSGIGIAMKKWTADAPYIARMKDAPADRLYQVYLDEKASYANSSAFYLDAADMLLEKGQRDLALRVLSNLAEMDLENRAVLRILGYRLLQAGAPELALPVFDKVQFLAEEEPQSYRDLGLAYAAAGKYQQAIDQLNEVVVRPWHSRFSDIAQIALAELNALVATAPAGAALDTSRIDPRLLKNMPLDLRTVLTWDADNTDMDLWVTDPNGEKCYFSNKLTYQGGRMSRDFTGGYGPEEFSLRDAKPGKYRIEVNYYGSRQQVVAGATTLQVRLTTGFGTRSAKDEMITLRLRGKNETVFVGEFTVK